MMEGVLKMTHKTFGREINNAEFIIHFAKGNTDVFNFCCEISKKYPIKILLPLFLLGCTSTKFLLFYNSVCKNKINNLLRNLAFLNSLKSEEYIHGYKNLLHWNRVGTLDKELETRKF